MNKHDDSPRVGVRRAIGFSSSWLVLGLTIAGVIACAQPAGAPPDGPIAGNEPHSGAPRGTLSWTRGDWPAELRADPEWQAAAHGESWALLRVADRRTQLRQQVEAGGPAAEVALRAWPLSKFSWVERGVLCRVLPRYVASDWELVLSALRESADSASAFGEVLDPEAVFVCERTFELLERQTSAMSPLVFDQYAATCEAFGRKRPSPPL